VTGPSPFVVDPARRARVGRVLAEYDEVFPGLLATALEETGRDGVHPAAIVPAAAVAGLVETLGLEGPEEALLLALGAARELAQPPVSGFRVGAAALAAPSGDLVLGGNVEVPGAAIWSTVHAEGFVALLARARGEQLRVLAVDEARPCAHCRQVLAELDGSLGDADGLRLVDPLGHDLRLAELYPWPFAPGDLERRGALPGDEPWPALALVDAALPLDVSEALVRAGRRSHAPYSRTPASVAVRLLGDALATGTVLESVAFNPTIGPLQDALVAILAAGRAIADIEAAWLAVPREARVGHEAMARDLLAAAAPGAPLHVTYWT
jgi:cytidine deaminase